MTNETTRKLTDFNYHSQNPFIQEVAQYISNIKYRKAIGSKYQQVLNEDTGELENQKVLVLGDKTTVDKQQYYKVFYGSIKSFFGLSSNSMKLFEYIMEQIAHGKDKICLPLGDAMETTKMPRTSMYRATIQLLDVGIIAKADREGCYYINPTVAFKGDRVRLVKEYVLSEKDREVKGIMDGDETDYYKERLNNGQESIEPVKG